MYNVNTLSVLKRLPLFVRPIVLGTLLRVPSTVRDTENRLLTVNPDFCDSSVKTAMTVLRHLLTSAWYAASLDLGSAVDQSGTRLCKRWVPLYCKPEVICCKPEVDLLTPEVRRLYAGSQSPTSEPRLLPVGS